MMSQRKHRALIRIEWVDSTHMGFSIPGYIGNITFTHPIPDVAKNKVSAGDRMYARTQTGSEDSRIMTFEEWEYPKQMTDEELDAFYKKLISKDK